VSSLILCMWHAFGGNGGWQKQTAGAWRAWRVSSGLRCERNVPGLMACCNAAAAAMFTSHAPSSPPRACKTPAFPPAPSLPIRRQPPTCIPTIPTNAGCVPFSAFGRHLLPAFYPLKTPCLHPFPPAGSVPFSAFGVFDGHGGRSVATFASNSLLRAVMAEVDRSSIPLQVGGYVARLWWCLCTTCRRCRKWRAWVQRTR